MSEGFNKMRIRADVPNIDSITDSNSHMFTIRGKAAAYSDFASYLELGYNSFRTRALNCDNSFVA